MSTSAPSPPTALAGPPDPRPRVVTGDGGEARLSGWRCGACGHPLAVRAPCCPVCGGALRDARFGPAGTVWSSTVVRVPVAGREPPYALAYVDLDDGPRLLAHVRGVDQPLAPGARVRLAGTTGEGDPEVVGAP